jgi:magnesium-transporting ATPase (P-type)
MITGDHSLTGVTVAKDCKLVQPGVRIFQSTLVADKAAAGGQRIEWVDTDDESLKLDPLTLRLPQHVLAESADRQLRYELAVTGPAYKLLQEAPDSKEPGSYFHRVILNGQVRCEVISHRLARNCT